MKTLIVRPSGACEETCKYLTDRGLDAVPLPLLRVVPQLPHHGLIKSAFAQSDVIVATSANVSYALYCNQGGIDASLPLCAVGKKTASAMRQFFKRIYLPEHNSSEGLIALLQENPHWQRITLLKGMGGRTEITRNMVNVGRKVQCLSLYRRLHNNQIEPTEIHWQYVQNIVVTSVELVMQLLSRWPLQDYPNIKWLVFSDRIANELKAVGIYNVSKTPGMDNQAIFEALNK